MSVFQEIFLEVSQSLFTPPENLSKEEKDVQGFLNHIRTLITQVEDKKKD